MQTAAEITLRIENKVYDQMKEYINKGIYFSLQFVANKLGIKTATVLSVLDSIVVEVDKN